MEWKAPAWPVRVRSTASMMAPLSVLPIPRVHPLTSPYLGVGLSPPCVPVPGLRGRETPGLRPFAILGHEAALPDEHVDPVPQDHSPAIEHDSLRVLEWPEVCKQVGGWDAPADLIGEAAGSAPVTEKECSGELHQLKFATSFAVALDT